MTRMHLGQPPRHALAALRLPAARNLKEHFGSQRRAFGAENASLAAALQKHRSGTAFFVSCHVNKVCKGVLLFSGLKNRYFQFQRN